MQYYLEVLLGYHYITGSNRCVCGHIIKGWFFNHLGF